MILSTKHRFIFWHVPKAAGSSIASMLAQYSHDLSHVITRPEWQRSYLVKNWMHINQDDFKRETAISGLQATHYRETAFVRHPYNVMVSKYNYATQEIEVVSRHGRQKHKPNSLPFDQYLTKTITRTDGSWHAFPQCHWTENPFTSAGVKVFKVEDLPTAWLDFQQYINLELPPLTHENRSQPIFSVDDLTPDQKDRIYNHFKCDFDAFGYER